MEHRTRNLPSPLFSFSVSLDFNPHGTHLTSGSADTNLKIWDLRRKTCVQTYKEHSEAGASKGVGCTTVC